MSDKPNLQGNCEVENCNRPLHRKTGHILFNANTDQYEEKQKKSYKQIKIRERIINANISKKHLVG